MPQLKPYFLTFRGGMHIGVGVENLNTTLTWVPSDTLWSALLSTWHLMGRDVAEILPNPQAVPPFRITSAFPFAGKVRFFPMPVDLRAVFSEEALRAEGAGKTIKRIRYLSEGLLRLALDGSLLDEYLPPKDEDVEPKKGLVLQGGAVWLRRDDVDELPGGMRDGKGRARPLRALRHQKVWTKNVVPRVTVPRVNSASELFQTERVAFADGCGLWFGVDGHFPDLEALITLLGENGLGGERTSGYGGFAVRGASRLLSLPDVTSGTRACLLSRWHPRADEVQLLQQPESAYRLESVGGYLQTFRAPSQRRKRLWMVAEGSLLPMLPKGDAPDVRPTHQNPEGDVPHPVYRPGFAVAFGWPIHGG